MSDPKNTNLVKAEKALKKLLNEAIKFRPEVKMVCIRVDTAGQCSIGFSTKTVQEIHDSIKEQGDKKE